MVSFRVLLTGKNEAMIDDFFDQMSPELKSVTTSMRRNDMSYHINHVNPDALVICLDGENKDELMRILEAKDPLNEIGAPIIVIGSDGDVETFKAALPGFCDYAIKKPVTVEVIKDSIINYLERRSHEAPVEAAAPQYDEVVSNQKPIFGELKRKHVLVIDDDTMSLKMIREMLKDTYDVATAPGGKVARAFLSNKGTDLILLDYEMPIEDGPYVYRSIRAMEKYKETPILFLTGVSDQEKIKEALILKPQGYILKPINKETLLATLDGFLL